MVAQQKVGKTAAALVLVLVIETQCRVNVNVRLNIPNSGSGSATGHIEGDIFVPGPAPAFQLRPGQLSPSSSHGNKKSTDLIKPREMMSRSSPRLTDKMLEKERHRTTGVGKILFAGGYSSSSPSNKVNVFDPVTKKTCYMPDLPFESIQSIDHSRGAGVLIEFSGDSYPMICGGYDNNEHGNCYIYVKSIQKWMTKPGFGEETSLQAMVSLGQWAFSAGSRRGNYKNTYSIVDRNGNVKPAQGFSPAMTVKGACAAVIKEEENGKTIAVVGGQVDRNGEIFKNMTTIFHCDNIKEEPVCKQLRNWPTLNTRHYYSNCGVIQAENGRKILLAMKDETAESKVETLDLDDNTAQWEILKGENIETNISSAQWNSFIVSQDPRKGYYFPPDKTDDLVHEYYEVTCKSAKECDFKKESLGEFIPRTFATTISLPTNHGLKCE